MASAAQDTPTRLPGSEPTDLQTCRPLLRRFSRVPSGAGAVWQEHACRKHGGALVIAPLFAVPPYSAESDGGLWTLIALLLGIAVAIGAVLAVGLYWRWQKARAPLADSDVQIPNLFASGVSEHHAPDITKPARTSDDDQRRRHTLPHPG